MNFKKLIHLLYVPTLYCNLQCDYCYLHEQTNYNTESSEKILHTLETAIHKFEQANILPFNISLHGGEVTTLGNDILEKLFMTIQNHYLTHNDILLSQGFNKFIPHIKTNLFSLDKHIKLFDKYKVSISGSLDLPLKLHEKHRITKNGKSSLESIISNIKKLSNYPHKKKISATLFSEHIQNPEQFIEDIWYINDELKFDMNNFNIMFGFCSKDNNQYLEQVSDISQSDFYKILKNKFIGTELEYGFKNNWFEEFTPNFCTNSVNCGEKFFLLQSSGDVYSCVRGQGNPEFHYGNIYNNTIEEILTNGKEKINIQHQKLGFNDDCAECGYLSLCNTGCPYVKHINNSSKSYTCNLQKTIYDDNPFQFPLINEQKIIDQRRTEYIANVHPNLLSIMGENEEITALITEELYDKKNELLQIIEQDNILKILYSNNSIKLVFDGEQINLKSQILKGNRDIYTFSKDFEIKLLINNDFFLANTTELVRNTLFISLLRNTQIVYGDEQRLKQEHLIDYQVYYSLLDKVEYDGVKYVIFDLSHFLKSNETFFKESVLNNIFITTSNLRNYHYEKQKKNAFYHIQAINLPFQNIEFYWINI